MYTSCHLIHCHYHLSVKEIAHLFRMCAIIYHLYCKCHLMLESSILVRHSAVLVYCKSAIKTVAYVQYSALTIWNSQVKTVITMVAAHSSFCLMHTARPCFCYSRLSCPSFTFLAVFVFSWFFPLCMPLSFRLDLQNEEIASYIALHI